MKEWRQLEMLETLWPSFYLEWPNFTHKMEVNASMLQIITHNWLVRKSCFKSTYLKVFTEVDLVTLVFNLINIFLSIFIEDIKRMTYVKFHLNWVKLYTSDPYIMASTNIVQDNLFWDYKIPFVILNRCQIVFSPARYFNPPYIIFTHP